MSAEVRCAGCGKMEKSTKSTKSRKSTKTSSLLKCSGCSLAYYCNAQCQRSHWKIHKKSCIVFKVESVDGKGMGMLASRDIKQGEIIIKEDPVLLLDVRLPESERLSLITDQYSKLSERERKKIDVLYDSNPDGDPKYKLLRIFKCNSIQVGCSESPAGLYPTVARINHSCSPNVVWSWTKDRENLRKEVRALTDISKGQELCTNYIDDFDLNYNTSEVRRNRLRNWHFECRCSVCDLPEVKLKENNDIRRNIWQNHEDIPSFVASQDIHGCIASAKRKLKGILSLGDQLISDLPSAYLEIYEFLHIAKALKIEVEDPEPYRSKAEELSRKFGDKFVDGYEKKIQEILQC